jgi:hypothetical protein
MDIPTTMITPINEAMAAVDIPNIEFLLHVSFSSFHWKFPVDKGE